MSKYKQCPHASGSAPAITCARCIMAPVQNELVYMLDREIAAASKYLQLTPGYKKLYIVILKQWRRRIMENGAGADVVAAMRDIVAISKEVSANE